MGFLDNIKRSISSDDADSHPSRQERYVLQRQLGSGGMGEVWLATDTLLDRPVAIKYLTSFQSNFSKDRFLSEARFLAQLHHPNITLIYDAVFDEQHDKFFLVMEYVAGKTLLDVIHERPERLPLNRILALTRGILEALHYAHEQGIVHRDIKPANVILQGDQVKLTDFGVAGLMSLLATGKEQLQVGTPTYMAPEQILGEAVDGRADLYSLGVMVYVMASGGQLPFKAANAIEIQEAHLKKEPRPLRLFYPEVPYAFERALMRLLAKEADDRYASAGVALEIFKTIQARHKFSQPYLNLVDAEAKLLVGRSEQLSRLSTAWAEVQKTAQPRLVVVTGKPGLGKSKLAISFLGCRVVDKGQTVLIGRGSQAGTPYGPFGEMIAAIFNRGLPTPSISEQRLNQLFEAIPNLPRLLNVDRDQAQVESPPLSESVVHGSGIWQRLGEKMSTQPAPSLPQEQQQLFSTILALLVELGPTVLYLEDATRLDQQSVLLAQFLVNQSQLPLLLLAACRDPDQAQPWYESFAADKKLFISLSPLPASAVKNYLANLLQGTVSDTVVDTVMGSSGGNPLKIQEISQRLVERKEISRDQAGQWRYSAKEIEAPPDAFLPGPVLAAFTRKIDQLSPPHRKLLILAAMLEPDGEFDVTLWVTLLGGQSHQAVAREVLTEAQQKRLVHQVNEGRYAFRPADLAKALIATLPESQRKTMHRKIAQLLRQNQASPALIDYHQAQAER